MQIDFASDKPIFLQIAQQIEDGVFTGAFTEETQIPSTTEISTRYNVNPATVLKGMNQLVDSGIIYKKRGVGMFVSHGARKKVIKARQDAFMEAFIEPMLKEAHSLGLSTEDIIHFLNEHKND